MSSIAFLESQIAALPHLAAPYGTLLKLRERRHWHELTEHLLASIKAQTLKPESEASEPVRQLNLVELYRNFISEFESKLNQLSLVLILAEFAKQFYAYRPGVVVTAQNAQAEEVREALSFIEPLLEKEKRLGEAATIVLKMKVAELHLLLGENKIARAALDDAQAKLPAVEGSESEAVVKSHFHRVGCLLYKTVGPADRFYRRRSSTWRTRPRKICLPASVTTLPLTCA